MKKLLALIIILIITEKTVLAQSNERQFAPVLLMDFLGTKAGPGSDISFGILSKFGGLVGGLKTYTVKQTKTKRPDVVLVPCISLFGRLRISEYFFVSPYATAGNGGYKELGIKPAYVYSTKTAFTTTANWNNANNSLGFGLGVIKIF